MKNAEEGSNEQGYIRVYWSVYKTNETLSNSDLGIDQFEVFWDTDAQREQIYSVSVDSSDSWVLIPVEELG